MLHSFDIFDKLCRCQIIVEHFAYTITMYEVTLSTPTEQNYLLEGISTNLSRYIAQIDGTHVTLQRKNRSYLSIACRETFRHQLQHILQDEVATTLSLGYKNIFVRRLLDLDNANFYQNVLIDTMCAFDHKYDVHQLAGIVDATSNIYIDGYYNFRMTNFKRRWQNVVNMVLENDYLLHDNELILEFLQYLLQSVDVKTQQLSVCFDTYGYTLYDATGKVVQSISAFSLESTAEQSALVNAICQNVQQLKVYHSSDLSQDFCDIAKALFNVKFVQVT